MVQWYMQIAEDVECVMILKSAAHFLTLIAPLGLEWNQKKKSKLASRF